MAHPFGGESPSDHSDHVPTFWTPVCQKANEFRVEVILYLFACGIGLGLAVQPSFLGDREAGLKCVTGTLDDCRRPLRLLTHPDLRNTTRVRAVCNVIQDVMQQHLGELEGITRKAGR